MTLDTRTLFRNSYPSGRRTLYVSGAGADSNSGLTAALPKRSLQAIVDIAGAGDRILVDNGTYDYFYIFQKVQNAGAWLTIENVPGSKPVIDVTNSVTSYDSTKLNNGFDVQLSAYAAVYGLEVHGSQTTADTNPSGVGIFRGSHHIAIWCCDIHDFPGGGVNCFYIGADSTYPTSGYPAGGWDAVDVFFNTIHATSKYSPYNTSGISFYGAENLTGLIDGTYGYRAVGNLIYDVLCTVPYTPGGQTQVTDGNGISPDSLAVPNNLNPTAPVYLKRGLVEGNVIVACGGRGVHIYNTKNVDVVHNTFVGNLRSAPTSTAIAGSSEVDLQLETPDAANGVVIAGNVFAPMNTAKTLDTSAQTVTANTVLGGTDTITAGNVNARATGLSWFVTAPTQASLVAGVALASLAPVAPAAVARRTGTLGYQALAAGGRAPATIAAGAMEVSAPVRVFR